MTSSSQKWDGLTRVEKLGEILVKFNALKLSQLTDLIEEQRKNPEIKLGELAVIKGFITKDALLKFLDIQLKENRVVDDSLKELGMMTKEEKWERLSQHERLGEILIKRNILKLSQLTEAMDEQALTPEKHLGTLLIEKGLVTEEELEEALAWQNKRNQVLDEVLNETKHNQ